MNFDGEKAEYTALSRQRQPQRKSQKRSWTKDSEKPHPNKQRIVGDRLCSSSDMSLLLRRFLDQVTIAHRSLQA